MLENPAVLWYNKSIKIGRFSAHAGYRAGIPKAEKTSALEIEGQRSLFNEMESCAEPDAHKPDLAVVDKHLRKRKYAGQREKLISICHGIPWYRNGADNHCPFSIEG